MGTTGGESRLWLLRTRCAACRPFCIAPGLRHLKRLHDNALARKRGVPMNNQWHDRIADRVLAPVLPRTHRALDDRRNDFQMRGVECQRQVHFAARRHHVRRKALMVLNVARTKVGDARPSNSSNNSTGILYLRMLTKTLRRPRCAMPMTDLFSAVAADRAEWPRHSIGIRLSLALETEALGPRVLGRQGSCSRPSAPLISLSKNVECGCSRSASAGALRTASMRLMIQWRSSVLTMCMNSAPTVRQ